MLPSNFRFFYQTKLIILDMVHIPEFCSVFLSLFIKPAINIYFHVLIGGYYGLENPINHLGFQFGENIFITIDLFPTFCWNWNRTVFDIIINKKCPTLFNHFLLMNIFQVVVILPF